MEYITLLIIAVTCQANLGIGNDVNNVVLNINIRVSTDKYTVTTSRDGTTGDVVCKFTPNEGFRFSKIVEGPLTILDSGSKICECKVLIKGGNEVLLKVIAEASSSQTPATNEEYYYKSSCIWTKITNSEFTKKFNGSRLDQTSVIAPIINSLLVHHPSTSTGKTMLYVSDVTANDNYNVKKLKGVRGIQTFIFTPRTGIEITSIVADGPNGRLDIMEHLVCIQIVYTYLCDNKLLKIIARRRYTELFTICYYERRGFLSWKDVGKKGFCESLRRLKSGELDIVLDLSIHEDVKYKLKSTEIKKSGIMKWSFEPKDNYNVISIADGKVVLYNLQDESFDNLKLYVKSGRKLILLTTRLLNQHHPTFINKYYENVDGKWAKINGALCKSCLEKMKKNLVEVSVNVSRRESNKAADIKFSTDKHGIMEYKFIPNPGFVFSSITDDYGSYITLDNDVDISEITCKVKGDIHLMCVTAMSSNVLAPSPKFYFKLKNSGWDPIYKQAYDGIICKIKNNIVDVFYNFKDADCPPYLSHKVNEDSKTGVVTYITASKSPYLITRLADGERFIFNINAGFYISNVDYTVKNDEELLRFKVKCVGEVATTSYEYYMKVDGVLVRIPKERYKKALRDLNKNK